MVLVADDKEDWDPLRVCLTASAVIALCTVLFTLNAPGRASSGTPISSKSQFSASMMEHQRPKARSSGVGELRGLDSMPRIRRSRKDPSRRGSKKYQNPPRNATLFTDDELRSHCVYKKVDNEGDPSTEAWNPMFRRDGDPIHPAGIFEGQPEIRSHVKENEAWKIGQEYSLTQCSVQRVVACPTDQPSRRRGRILLLYMIHSWANDQRIVETQNYAHFLQFGLGNLSDSETGEALSKLYDGVDIVFFRIRESSSEIVKCDHFETSWGSVRTYFVPRMWCDLCGHHKLLKLLDFKVEYSTELPKYERWPWKTVIMMNSGVGGPFFGSGWSSWIDLLGMAGEGKRPAFWDDEELQFTTIGANSISWAQEVHAQSYFVAVPLSALSHFFSTYAKGCGNTKQKCIDDAELKTLYPFLQRNPRFKVYSFTRDFFHAAGENKKLLGNTYGFGGQDPSYQYQDPCSGIFLKLGGDATRSIVLSKKRAVYHVVRQMKHQKALSSQGDKDGEEDSNGFRLHSQYGFRSLIRWLRSSETGCRWFRASD